MNGVGIGLLPDVLCQNYINRGMLVKVFPEYTLPGKSIYLAYPRNRYMPKRVIALRDMILEAYK